MTCACGFDNGPSPGQRCAGCGKPLRPADDHEPPGPGRRIYPNDDPYVVTEEDREQWDDLENVVVIHELDYRWGNGIGADVYGYLTQKKLQVIVLEEPCEKCGCEKGLYDFEQSQCGHAGAKTIDCNDCGHEIERELFH